MISNIIASVVIIFVARAIGPVDYGKYAYAASMVLLFSSVGRMGLDGLTVRELLQKPKKHLETLGTITGVKSIGFFFAAILLLAYGIFSPAHTIEEKYLFSLGAMTLVCQPITGTLASWFQSRVELRYVAITNMFTATSGAALKLAAVGLGFGVVAVGAGQTISIIVGAVLLLIFYRWRSAPPFFQWKFSGQRARQLFSESWVIFAGSIFAMIYMKIDILMLRIFRGPEEVGIYSVAAIISELSYFVPAAIVTSVFPRLIELNKSSERGYEMAFEKLFGVLAFLGLFALIGLLALGPFVISIAFGVAYQESVGILMIHCFALPFIFMRQGFSRLILIKNLTKFSMITQGAGALINVLLNSVLIPLYGGKGAAIATVISYITASYLILYFFDKTKPTFVMMTQSICRPWKGGKTILTSLLRIVRNNG